MAEIFVTQPVPATALARLREVATVRVSEDATRVLPYERLREEVARCDILYCLLHDRVDSGIIAAGARLRLIANAAIVPANVDVAAATARKIPVTAIPNVVAEATADLQWALLMAAARRVVEADRALRAGMFPGAQSMHFVGGEVHGKTLGTIGLGAIGRGIAARAQGFDMRVLYTKRNRLSPEEERTLRVEFRSLDDLLRESDFVVVNASYHPGTHHRIGARELGLMRPTAYLINTARGPIVDEAALVEVLRARRIAGAALDVYEREPRVHAGLLDLDNTVLTPHIGSAARDTRERIAAVVADHILAFLRGARPAIVVNPEVFD
jgi:glyoxylate reductase